MVELRMGGLFKDHKLHHSRAVGEPKGLFGKLLDLFTPEDSEEDTQEARPGYKPGMGLELESGSGKEDKEGKPDKGEQEEDGEQQEDKPEGQEEEDEGQEEDSSEGQPDQDNPQDNPPEENGENDDQ
jgi:hypothetical protein